MMKFREIKNALVQVLGDEAEGRFRVIGYRGHNHATDEVTGNNRSVQVYYTGGEIPKTSGMRGEKKHDITINIDLSASAPAKVDLAVLDSPTATPQQKAAALLEIQTAADVADTQIDELIDYVFNILFDARNERLGLEKGIIANRWIGTITKDMIIERGDLVVKTAGLKYSCRVSEEVPGDIGVEPATVTFDTTVKIGDTEGAGVIVEIDNT